MNKSGLKTAVITILCLIVAAQAAWIITSTQPKAKPPSVKEVRVLQGRAGLEIELAAPLGADAPLPDQCAVLDPEAEGTWAWSNPYVLRFEATQPLKGNTQYSVTLAPETGIKGERAFTVQTGTFQLDDITFSERAGGKPATGIISVQLRFSGPVSPEDLLKHVTLTDETDNTPVPLQVMTSWSTRRMELRTDPLDKTTEGRTYRLNVSKGLQRAGSNLALTRDSEATFTLKIDPKLTCEGMTLSGSGLGLRFSTPMDPDSAAAFINVEPEADYTLSADGNTLLLSGGFTPGVKYTVTLRQGLTAADGAVLQQGIKATAAMPDLSPSVDFTGSGLFLPRSARTGLVLKAVNAGKLTVRIDRVYPNNLFAMLSEYGGRIFEEGWDYGGVPSNLGGKLFEQTFEVKAAKNETATVPLAFGNALRDMNGLLRISADIRGGESARRWLILSDIGLIAKRDSRTFHVWAVSNKTLKPIPGLKLTLISDKNQRLGRAVTGNYGTASLKLPENNDDGSPYLIMAEGQSGDFTFLLLSRFGVDTTGLDVSGVRTSRTGMRAFLYGERDLYRPGETFKGMAVVRQNDLAAPPSQPLVLVHRDSKGRVARKIRLTTGKDGTADFTLALPAYALTGTHSLALMAGKTVIGTYRFKVEEFIPDRIKVELLTGKTAYEPGQAIGLNVRSSYLFGPPAANLPVTLRGVLRAAPFAPTGLEDYVFGDPEREFQAQEFYASDGTLDANGTLSGSLPVPEGLTPPAALEAVLYGRVSEAGGRGVTAGKTVLVHPYAYYLGLGRLERNGLDPGKPISFRYVAAAPGGNVCAHGELTAKLYRDRWRTVVRQAPSGGFRYESVNDPQLVDSSTIPPGEGKGEVMFTPPSYGSYRVTIAAADSGASSATAFYCGGWGYSPWALKNPARLELATDKDQYQPGETAVVQIRAPFPGRVLVAVEGDTVHDTQIVDLEGNTGEVRLPVKQAYAPNAHVTALLVRKAADVDEGSVGRAFGAVPLLVDNLSNKMALQIDAPEEIRPESELTVRIKADPGAVVTVAAVDEGILQLSGSNDPDPFGFFYARRALGVHSYDTFAMLYPDMARVMGHAKAGGGMAMMAESQFMRTGSILRVKPVSFWSGPLKADAKGDVSYTVRLPDFQGALRLVAVGLDGKRFGLSRSMTRVRSPLAVTPTLPRFLAAGDTMEMPVTLRNDLGRDGAVTMDVTAEGAVETDAQPITRDIADGNETTVYVPLKAKPGAGGAAKITIHATSGDESRRIVVDLPVRPALPYRRDAAFGVLKDKEGELLPAPEGFVPGTVTRTVTLGALPISGFAGKLEYLLRYPYGCAEQTTSKAFPLIRFNALARAFAPDLLGETGAPFMVQAALSRLSAMQTDSGGFAFWPGGREANPWVSAYVAHFLLEASQAGFGADFMLPRALNYLRVLPSTRNRNLDTVSYALFDLAKAGEPERGAMDELRDKHADKLSAAGRTLLACAYALSGDPDSFNALLAKLPELPEGREHGGGMGSGLRDAALMLITLADAAPDDRLVPELAAKVSRLMHVSRWGTTQENALAFTALGKTLDTADPGPFSGMLVSGDTEYRFDDVPTFSKRDIPSGGPIRAAMASDNATVYWSATTRGVPEPETVKPVSNGLEIRRTFLDREGNPLKATSLRQGDLVIMKTELRATGTAVENVVAQLLLPAGLEVENQRLATTETAAFAPKGERAISGHQDMRDDRILFFTDLRRTGWHAGYTQLRAVTPGSFALPPAQAEAMYDPAIMARGETGRMDVTRR
ncbi:alpha-2-macroglobulin family protein [Pseudodesulfovibrio cashew]|uniref:Alpha-2-macroglobulin family protein n=1 Tax=Pseudodesulfovibrio cashew TaxID=2678688 RepID=A0A6I6JBW8_9BACT|nr:alpha-2-macroglobulin [Pseudodesulfovibrio cashew]QGY38648.1 alpha-2-macroglobulin family protein [Pseudodesulfovibrio cashew]